MSQDLINRYQSGGDIYQSIATQYGQAAADACASAALSGDETAINAALAAAKYGAPLNTSRAAIFTNQILTDPLAAPLADANKLIGNSVFSFLKNPWVLAAVAVGVFIFLGGGTMLRGILAKGKK